MAIWFGTSKEHSEKNSAEKLIQANFFKTFEDELFGVISIYRKGHGFVCSSLLITKNQGSLPLAFFQNSKIWHGFTLKNLDPSFETTKTMVQKYGSSTTEGFIEKKKLFTN